MIHKTELGYILFFAKRKKHIPVGFFTDKIEVKANCYNILCTWYLPER
jgi:hypothetical protein